MDGPCIEIGLQRLGAVVEVLAQLHPEKRVEGGAVETLDEAVGLGLPNSGPAMADAVQPETRLAGMVPVAAGRAAPRRRPRTDGGRCLDRPVPRLRPDRNGVRPVA